MTDLTNNLTQAMSKIMETTNNINMNMILFKGKIPDYQQVYDIIRTHNVAIKEIIEKIDKHIDEQIEVDEELFKSFRYSNFLHVFCVIVLFICHFLF